MGNQNNSISIGAVFILLLIGATAGFQLGRWSVKQNISPSVYPTRSIYPTERVCTAEAKLCPDGSSVGRVGPNCEFAPCPDFTPSPINRIPTQDGCIRAGCSSQLCVESSQSDIVTTCEYKDEYSCFAYSRCERQEDGACGWTQTPEYSQCINSVKKNP